MKKLLILIIVILLASTGYILLTKQRPSNKTTVSDMTPTPLPAEVIPTGLDITSLQAAGSSYRDPDGIFTLLYPNDWKVDEQNNGQVTRIFKQGPTQQGQTELYDGVIVTFEKIDLKGQSLSQWVDQEISTMTQAESQITKPKQAVTVHGYPGYSYTARGLGEFTFFVLQKDQNSPYAVRITTLVSDPTNVGFQKQVDEVFSTLQIQK